MINRSPTEARPPTKMHLEANEAPAVVRRMLTTQDDRFSALADQLRNRSPELIITNARGSSDHASVFGKYVLMQRLGIPVLSGQPSLTSIYGRSLRVENAVGISVSQSGQSPDIIAAARAWSVAGAETITFTNSPSAPLAASSDHVVDLCAGPEVSVAATKSYIASLAAYLALATYWSNSAHSADLSTIPEALANSATLDWGDALGVLQNSTGLFVIGRGPCLGIAKEAALKFKETCQIHAEAYSSAECSHGPLALVGPQFPALMFVQDDEARDGTLALGKRMVEMGAPVLIAGASIPGAITLPTLKAPPALQPLMMIQTFYKMVADLAVMRGQNPDAPPALSKITETR